MKVGEVLLIVLLLAASFFLLFYHLSVEPFQDYDEATYAEISTENLASHQYFSFTFLDHPYFNKPPLLFWLIDASTSVIPDAEIAARAPSALAAVFLIIAAMVLVYEATRSVTFGVVSGAILAGTSAFIEPARQVRFDVLVSLFVMAAAYAFLRAFEDRRWFLAFGAFVGVAILSKGPLAVFALIAALGIAIAYKRMDWLRDPYFWGGVGICLLIAVPWHLYETLQFGQVFWEEYIRDQVVDRVGQALFTGPSNSAYIGYLFQFASPWIELWVASLVAAPFLWKRMSVKTQALFLAMVFGAIAVLAACFISKTQAIGYLIPLYPFIAVTVDLISHEVWHIKFSGIRKLVAAACICLCLFGFYLSFYNGLHINPYYIQEVSLANQEKIIGERLRTEHPATFYVFDLTTLGSIMYYSQLIAPLWVTSTPPPSHSYIVFPSSELQRVEQAYPLLKLTIVYQGTYITLGVVGG